MKMFNNSSVMLITSEEILRVDVDAATQKNICITFSEALNSLTTDKTRVVFDGSYKPNDDEFLAIENFQLLDDIKDAIRDPIGVKGFQKSDGEFPEIKAVFVGERNENGESELFSVALQRFRKEQYISTKWCNLFFDNNTFIQEKRFGISIADGIDCFYTNGELQFSSFYFARQIFDLAEYYRSATDSEVDSFTTSEKLNLEDAVAFHSMANTWIRRKIAMINDSQVLTNYSASEIKKRAKAVGVEIDVKDKKVIIPNEKEKVKIILGFLDEEAYKGPFSQNTYLANSKRQVK